MFFKAKNNQQKVKTHTYKLTTKPYFLLEESEKENTLRELDTLLATAKTGMLYVQRKKTIRNFLGNNHTIYEISAVLETPTELALETSNFPLRPSLTKVHEDYVETDQDVARSFVAYAYGTQVTEGALSDFTDIDADMIEVAIQFNSLQRDRVRAYLSNIDAKIARFSRYASNVSALEVMKTTSERIKIELDNFNAEPLSFRTIIILHSRTKNELDSLSKKLIMRRREDGIEIESPKLAYVQKLLYELSGRISYRVSTSTSIAKLYPLAGLSLLEEDGVFLGVDETGSPIAINLYLSKIRANPHMIISGTTGAGKTTTTALIIDRLKKIYKDDIYIFVIDPLGNFNRFFKDDNTIANYVWEYGQPMGLDPIKLALQGGINLGDLVDFFTELYQIPGKLRGLLAKYVEEAKSINDLINRIEEDTSNLSQQKLRNRNLEDLLAYLYNINSMPDKVVFSGNYPEDILKKRVIILGLKTDDNRHKRLASTLLILLAWSMINKLSREMKKMIIIDEAHLLLVYPSIAKILAFIYKTARNLRTSIITITQLVSDYNKNEFARDIFQLADTKLILKQEDTAMQDLKDLARLSDEEIKYIISASRGEGILKTGGVKTFIKIMLTEEEKAKWRTE